MEEEEVAAKSRRDSRLLFYNDNEVQWRHFCGTCKRTRKSKNML